MRTHASEDPWPLNTAYRSMRNWDTSLRPCIEFLFLCLSPFLWVSPILHSRHPTLNSPQCSGVCHKYGVTRHNQCVFAPIMMSMVTTLNAIEMQPEYESLAECVDQVVTQVCADTIQARVRIKTDARRLFQALVSPEYVETWLAIPGANSPSVVSFVTSYAPIAWECSLLDDASLRIQANFEVARRRRLSIFWKIENGPHRLENRISARLIGEFNHTTLSIFHAGFKSSDDRDWHQELWHGSLRRLANLYRHNSSSN